MIWPFLHGLLKLKSGLMTIENDLHVYFLLYQSLYDLTNLIGYNLISVLVLVNALGHNLISVLDFTNPFGCNMISVLGLTIHLPANCLCSYKPSKVSDNTLDSTLLGRTFLWQPQFSISFIFVTNQPLLKYL